MYDLEGYWEAGTVEEAVQLLEEHPAAKIICGGSDVLIKIREGKLAGTGLVSIRDIPMLQEVTLKENGDLYIGAAMTFSHLTGHPLIRSLVPVLGEAVDQVGGPQVRNIGTIGGNICNGAVSADSAPTVFSLECRLRIEGKEGARFSDMKSFYLGPGRVNLAQGEALTHIVVPREKYEGYAGHYIKYSMRNAMDIATLSCSTVCKIDLKKNVLEDVKMTFGVAAAVPLRVPKTEEALKGRPLQEDLYGLAAGLVRQEINPRDSWRASRAFRLQIGGEIAARSLREAVLRARAQEEVRLRGPKQQEKVQIEAEQTGQQQEIMQPESDQHRKEVR
ncbi:MAG: xanthine dehydrogenase FAD-binding subunit XdhB [Lachnospiraceae bacterium]|nr:xanthine dehydrogenase FAD-binding subunit XdhB [Lachnospiraceae bacterium]